MKSIIKIVLTIFISTQLLAQYQSREATPIRQQWVFKTLKKQLVRAGLWRKFKNLRTKRAFVNELKKVQGTIPMAKQVLQGAHPDLSGSNGLIIDPCDMKCLNCIGSHCPGCPDKVEVDGKASSTNPVIPVPWG